MNTVRECNKNMDPELIFGNDNQGIINLVLNKNRDMTNISKKNLDLVQVVP
jgi:hypothetical protein